MPQHPSRDSAPGTPYARDAFDPLGARRRAHPFDLADRGDKREIAGRPDVGATECHQKVDVRGPRTHASQFDQSGSRLVVFERRKCVGIEIARDDRPREVSDVGALLASESGAAQLGLGEGRDPPRRHRAGEPLEPPVGGATRRQRDLLLEDDLYQSLKARRPIPQRWRAVTLYDGREMRVASCELGHAFGERLVRQL
jgi:hypothetical protein